MREVRLNAAAATQRLSDPPPSALDLAPAKRRIGSFAEGQALLSGRAHLAGHALAFAPGGFWDIRHPSVEAFRAAHGFGWLADLSALGTHGSRRQAAALFADWRSRHGDGKGRCWQPGLAGRRAMALIDDHALLLGGASAADAAAYLVLLQRHRAYLTARAGALQEDRARVAALAGLVLCHLALDRRHAGLAPALAALGALAGQLVSAETGGAVASRAPEDLLEILSDLLTVLAALDEAEMPPGRALRDAVQALVPGLRHLRLGDGTLPRFHGGGGGAAGLLDGALSDSGVRATIHPTAWMGFARVTGGRVVAIMDCAAPASTGPAAALAHASTLGFELTSGRRPLVVNCGPGRGAPDGWATRARETVSHATLSLDGHPSSDFAPPPPHQTLTDPVLITPPGRVTLERGQDASGQWLTATHDGYLARFGLIHERRFFVEALGRDIRGEDILRAPSERAGRREQQRLSGLARLGLAAAARFHLHPDVEIIALEEGADWLGLRLKSGESWVFECSGGTPSVEDSQFVPPGAVLPVPSRQIVLRTRTKALSARLIWRFRRVDTSGPTRRDLARDDIPL